MYVPRTVMCVADVYKEEDFVSNTYNRDLLSSIGVDDLVDEILKAQETLKGLSEVSAEIKEGIDARLKLRVALLDEDWRHALSVLKAVEDSHSLGRDVPEAVSVKLQRQLASTMPPRPIIQLSFEESMGHLTRLAQDALEVGDVLDYKDSQSLQVCSP